MPLLRAPSPLPYALLCLSALAACGTADPRTDLAASEAATPTQSASMTTTSDGAAAPRSTKWTALPRTPGAAPADFAAARCDLRVRFGSYCCGPHRAARSVIDTWLEDTRSVIGVTTASWGREGEVDYCVTLAEPALAAEHLATLKALIAAMPADGTAPLPEITRD